MRFEWSRGSKLRFSRGLGGLGEPLGASWEPLWHHLGSKTLPESIFNAFWMDLASILGGKIDQKSIGKLLFFLHRFWDAFWIDFAAILIGF